jgi:outer membrane protein assembly factor BamB
MVRRWLFAGCLVLVLAAVTGAAAPRALLSLVRSWPVESAGHIIEEDQLFVLTVLPELALSAYHLPDGRLSWSVPVTAGELYGAWQAGDAVVVLTKTPQESCCRLTAIARDDGEVRWSRLGEPVAIDVGNRLVALRDGFSTQVVEMGSGRVLWQGADSQVVTFGPQARQILTYLDGYAERRDLSTGKVLAGGQVHPPDKTLTANTIVDSKLIVSYASEFRNGTVAAYDVDTLAPLWQRSGYQADGVEPCGPVLCLRAGRGVEVVDPRTGVAQWRVEDWYAQAQGGRLLVFASDLEQLRPVGVVDPLTGRSLLDLRPWRMTFSIRPYPDLVLTTKPARDRWTTVAIVDLTRLTIRVVGVIPGQVSECQRGEAVLVCRNQTDGLQLWALRR